MRFLKFIKVKFTLTKIAKRSSSSLIPTSKNKIKISEEHITNIQ